MTTTRDRTSSLLKSIKAQINTKTNIPLNKIIYLELVKSTKHVLNVETLAPEIIKSIISLIKTFTNACFFLKSPVQMIESDMTPLCTKYFEYLISNRDLLMLSCNIESFLMRTLDADMRETFHNATFESQEELLETCSLYREQMVGIVINENTNNTAFMTNKRSANNISKYESNLSSGDVEMSQVILDLIRERIRVNGTVLPPLSVYINTKKKCTNSNNYNSVVQAFESAICLGGKLLNNQQLIRRILVAVSRTVAGGDAYYIVNDLFGGEDVAVVQATNISNDYSIDIQVYLAQLVVRCYSSYDVYPHHLVGSNVKPLIRVNTVTKTHIPLKEVRLHNTHKSSSSNFVFEGPEVEVDSFINRKNNHSSIDNTTWRFSSQLQEDIDTTGATARKTVSLIPTLV